MADTAEAQEKAKEVAGQAQQRAQQAAGQAKGRIAEQVDQRSTQAGEQVKGTASDIRSVAEGLREQGKDGPARLAEQLAQRAEGVGDYLVGKDGDGILHDVEDYARSNPWVVVAGGAALGFVASRLLKASSARRYEGAGGDRGSNGTYAGAGQLPPSIGQTPDRPTTAPVGGEL